MAVHEEYEAVSSVFDAMESHLRIMQPIAPTDIDHALREPSVKLLAQILRVLGVITKLQQDGRFREYLCPIAFLNNA